MVISSPVHDLNTIVRGYVFRQLVLWTFWFDTCRQFFQELIEFTFLRYSFRYFRCNYIKNWLKRDLLSHHQISFWLIWAIIFSFDGELETTVILKGTRAMMTHSTWLKPCKIRTNMTTDTCITTSITVGITYGP